MFEYLATIGIVPIVIAWLASIWLLNRTLHKAHSIRPKNEEERKRDEKYSMFKQLDVKVDSFATKAFLFSIGGPLLVARVSFAIVGTFSSAFSMFVVGKIMGNKTPLARWMLTFISKCLSKCWTFVCSILWVSHNYPTACYKKYLGPDWKPSYDRPSTIVANHSSWVDICMMMTKYTPSFISKASVRKVPGIGFMAEINHTLFMDRASKDDRKAMFAKIDEHQKRAEAGEINPLVMHPEGGTTNGTALVNFKSGAFAGLNSVQPVAIKYNSSMIPLTTGVLEFQDHILLVGINPIATASLNIYPVFKPNDYFWAHHLKPGEEKMDCYARVIRAIIAEACEIPMVDIDMNEKMTYRDLVWPNMKHK